MQKRRYQNNYKFFVSFFLPLLPRPLLRRLPAAPAASFPSLLGLRQSQPPESEKREQGFLGFYLP